MDLVITKEQRLTDQKIIIETNLDGFLAVGRAVMVIRDEKLYEVEGYKSLRAFVAANYSKSRKSLYEYMEAAFIAEDLSPMSDILAIDAYQALGEIADKTERQTVLMLAQTVKAKPTAPIIKAATVVVEDMRISGGTVNIGDGLMRNATAATIKEVAEARNRQRDYINDKYKSKELIKETCTLQQACERLAELALTQGDQVVVKLLVYQLPVKAVRR